MCAFGIRFVCELIVCVLHAACYSCHAYGQPCGGVDLLVSGLSEQLSVSMKNLNRPGAAICEKMHERRPKCSTAC